MPPSSWTGYDKQRTVGLAVDEQHDADDDFHGHVGQERFGPEIADTLDAKILNFTSSSSRFSPPKDAYGRLPHDFSRVQHNVSNSIATTTSSLASADADDAEAIELSALRSLARTARAQSNSITGPGFTSVSTSTSSHGRFNSTASAASTNTATSLPSTRTSTSEDVFLCEGQIGDRSAVRPSCGEVREAGNHNPRSACNPRDACDLIQPAVLCADDRPTDESESTHPLRPMSPRQTRLAHRIYVPSSTHHDDTHKFHDDLSEAELGLSPSSSTPDRLSPESEHTIAFAVETDSLLPLQKALAGSQDDLSLPVTTSECDEPTQFPFSFSRIETAFHAAGLLVTTILVVLSVWLTLSNVVM